MMKLHDDELKKPGLMVFWLVWFAIFNGLCIMLFVAGRGWPSGVNKGSPEAWMVGVSAVAVVASIGIRFLVIPKKTDLKALLPMMVVGLALAEVAGVFGIFIIGEDFPETRQALFLSSIGAVIAHAPVYVSVILEREKLMKRE